jgi:membrane protease YdiL (CAAX protease family)
MRKHPLIAFFVLAYLLTWWIYPLLKFSPLLGIFGLFGPAIAAIIMAAVTDGKSGVKALLRRVVLWRVGLPWYVIALGLPTILSLATAALAYLVGATEFIRVGALAPIELVLFVLVVGEELGWRGYALPRLLEKRSALTASLILGVLWGLWHLPTFLVPALSGLRAADHRVFDLDDLGLPPHARQRSDCDLVPWRYQPLSGRLRGCHRRSHQVLVAVHCVRRCCDHCCHRARLECVAKAGGSASIAGSGLDYFLINFPDPETC